MKELEAIRTWLLQQPGTKERAMAGPKKFKGYRVLFDGPAGDSKIATVETLGKEFNKPVYPVHLSQVISKYIGETEKNLAAVFEKAESKDSILFFDEADALFGKRTTVKDAHDRYANLEVSYLLKKMEEYPGLAILATNLKKNIDEGFIRRFQTVIHFPKN